MYAARTEVPFEKSVRDILALIRKAGAEQIGQFEDGTLFAIQFKLNDRLIRFRLDTAPSGKGARASSDQFRRSRGRALHLVIKGKLESVESGIETLEQAFLANVVMANGQTVYERIAEPIALEYKSGLPDATFGLLPPPGGGS